MDINFDPAKDLVKYSKYTYLKESYEKGIFRISPAKKYNDPTLNPGIQDNELLKKIRLDPKKIKTKVRDTNSNEESQAGNVHLNRFFKEDFYIFCLSSSLDFKLFDVFDADSCLVIFNENIFTDRLRAAVNEKIPLRVARGNEVSYYDPTTLELFKNDFPFTKDKYYKDQKEFRIAFFPKKSEQELTYIHVELGNLEDCCRLYLKEEITR